MLYVILRQLAPVGFHFCLLSSLLLSILGKLGQIESTKHLGDDDLYLFCEINRFKVMFSLN